MDKIIDIQAAKDNELYREEFIEELNKLGKEHGLKGEFKLFNPSTSYYQMMGKDAICNFEYNRIKRCWVTCEISTKGCNVFIHKNVANHKRKSAFDYLPVCGILFNNSKDNLNWILDNLDKFVDNDYDLDKSLVRFVIENGKVLFNFTEAIKTDIGATDCIDIETLCNFNNEYQDKNKCKTMGLGWTLNRKRMHGKCIKEYLMYSCDTEDNQKILICDHTGIREATKEEIDRYLVKK